MRMNDTFRIKNAVSVLSSLVNFRASQVEDRAQQAHLFWRIAKFNAMYFPENRFETACSYCNAFMGHPDAIDRLKIAAGMFKHLPDRYAGYEDWEKELAPKSTKGVLAILEKLRWFHIKLLLLQGKSEDASKLLKPKKPKPQVSVEARPPLPLEREAAATVPPVAQTAYSPSIRGQEADEQPPEWSRYEAISWSQQESHRMRQETAKALAEKEARKKALKEAKKRPVAEGEADKSEPSDDDTVVASHQESLVLPKKPYSIFEKFFLLKSPDGAAIGTEVPLAEYEGLTFEDNVDITP